MHASLKCYQKYNGRSQGYSHRIEEEGRIQQCIPVEVKTKCTIRKIIRMINNLLKFNMFQSALFCWLLKKSHSTFHLRLSQFDQTDLSEIKVLTQEFEKRVFLILLLNGYYVKTNFIANGSQIEVDENVLENVPAFRQLYKAWKPQKSIKNINLTEINNIYESWNPNHNSSFLNNKVDYNKIVDKILFLSKTYNVSGGDEVNSVKDTQILRNQRKQLPHKKRKPNQKSQKQLTIKYCEEKDINYDGSPMKNSVCNKMGWFEEDKNMDINPLRRSTRGMNMMNRSIFEIREDKDDMNPNQNLFRSYRSRDSQNIMGSLKQSGHNRYLNMNSIFLSNNQSIGLGNLLKSSEESNFLHIGENTLKVSQNRREQQKAKLKPTSSYEDLMK